MKGKERCMHIICIIFSILLMTGVFGAEETLTVNQKVDQIISEVIRDGMSEKDQALVLHDYLTDHAFYDLTFSHYEADGVLLYGTGVCDSYSKAYQLLLDRVGIENVRLTGHAVTSDGRTESHTWNAVKIDGKWSHVDVTWDDPVNPDNPDSSKPKSGDEQHVYFMVSNRVMLEDHSPDLESTALIEARFSDEEILPDPVAMKLRVEAPDFSLETSSGKLLTKAGYGNGKKLLMVYGRTTCGNTLMFLNTIKPYINKLKEKNVITLLALFDNPSTSEIKQMESSYPGIVSTKITDSDYSMWEGLSACGHKGNSVIFPVVFLKNAQNAFVYYSVGYVDDPLTVVAGALAMPEGASPSSAQSEEGTQEKDDPSEQNTASKDDPSKQNTTSTDTMKSVVTGNGKYKLNLSKKTATLTGTRNRNITKLVIPAAVKANHTSYKVTAIGTGACRGLKKLSAVTIGKNVGSIGKNAFYGCVKLKTVSGGKGLTKIGAGAFQGCKLLAKITLYAKVKTIGKNAFLKCAKLKTIVIKSSKLTSKTVGTNTFKGIYAKAAIKVPKEKLKAYTKLLKKKGIGKKVRIIK